MGIKRPKSNAGDKRQYIRVEGVLPVEFYVIDNSGKKITPWLQGFTRDIGKGGICLNVNDLWWGFSDRFNFFGAQLFVKIDLPFSSKELSCEASVVWVNQDQTKEFNRYSVGLEFKDSRDKEVSSLFRYAWIKKLTPICLITVLVGLLLFSLTSFYRINSLINQRRKMVKDYVDVLENVSVLGNQLQQENGIKTFIEKRSKELNYEIANLERRLGDDGRKYESLKSTSSGDKTVIDKIKTLNNQIIEQNLILSYLKRENEFIKRKAKQQIISLNEIELEFERLYDKKNEESIKIISGLYDWIKNRQDLVNGLVLSYEGDKNLDKVCFTYDQALAVIVFLLENEPERAEKVLDFYADKVSKQKGIFNAYYTNGYPFEMINHCGPVAWIGISALTYTKVTGDDKYLPIARYAAEFLLEMMDSDGGIKGGPTVKWYSTEHHLDAFAFFDLLYLLDKNEKYRVARDRIKNWISKYVYTTYGPPVKRGKGDSTIATDTYSWSITALGPKLLNNLKMNPDAILDFAIEHCGVKTKFKYHDRELIVKGFDFAKFKNISRGGIVSSEWTSQMILAFEIMANYYKDKDSKRYNAYLGQARLYFDELQKMLITSLSKVGREDPCLPYASAASVDTGHGWRTPQGDRTGSLAATAYFIIAYYGYNPLQATQLEVSLKKRDETRNSTVTPKTN